jgi:hypothetical protein
MCGGAPWVMGAMLAHRGSELGISGNKSQLSILRLTHLIRNVQQSTYNIKYHPVILLPRPQLGLIFP